LAERGKLEKFNFDSMRLVLFAGEIFPIKYLRKIMNHMQNASFYNMYGQTEANSSTFYLIKDLPDDDAWKIPIGKPFPNYEVFALDQKNKIIDSPGLEGELYVRGSAVAMGYWKDTEKTAACFVQDPIQTFSSNKVYRTGDVVSLDDSGNYIFIGRKDHMVKSRGYRIEIDEIEIALHSYPGIRQAAIITVPDDLIGNRIIGYVSVIDDEKIQEPEILGHCAKRIPKYMLPEAVEICPSLPTTSTGKIDRKLLSKEALLKYKP
jgi:acyl-coenzyme A synthetase/AMP-(fatty) acid ligase